MINIFMTRNNKPNWTAYQTIFRIILQSNFDINHKRPNLTITTTTTTTKKNILPPVERMKMKKRERKTKLFNKFNQHSEY